MAKRKTKELKKLKPEIPCHCGAETRDDPPECTTCGNQAGGTCDNCGDPYCESCFDDHLREYFSLEPLTDDDWITICEECDRDIEDCTCEEGEECTYCLCAGCGDEDAECPCENEECGNCGCDLSKDD